MTCQAKTNIIFIVIDALRADMLSTINSQAVSTPTIDCFAREGVLFQDAYSCTNATDSSITSMMTGLYPARHGIIRHGAYVSDKEKLQVQRVPMLAEILCEAGYKTMSIDWLGRWHKRGFDIYTGITQRGTLSKSLYDFLSRHNLWGMASKILSLTKGRMNKAVSTLKVIEDAQVVVDQAINLLRSHNLSSVPFFLFIHFWDLHAPYRPIDRFVPQTSQNVRQESRVAIRDVTNQLNNSIWQRRIERWTDGYTYVDEFVAAYQSEVLFVDEQIGRLLSEIRQLNLDKNTLIILTSDHGESFCEHSICFDHHGLYECTVHVPLIIRLPDLLPAETRVKGLVQHIDLMPTLLKLLNVPFSANWDGCTLLPVIEDGASRRSAIYLEEALTEHKIAVRTNRHKYIRAVSEQDAVCRYCGIVHGGQEELYDLEQDPLESNNMIQARPDLREMLHHQLSDWQATMNSEAQNLQISDSALDPGDLTDEGEKLIEQRLRDLGYL